MKAKKVKDSIKEGVADKFAEKHFGIRDEIKNKIDKIEKEISLQRIIALGEKIIVHDANWVLIKNPSSIDFLGPDVRGVITENGDLYMENFSEKIHNDILKILYSKGILKGEFSKKWTKKLPEQLGFLTVQRYKNTDYICIGESNSLLYNEEDYNKYLPYYTAFINKAKEKNPKLNFQNKLVGTKYPIFESDITKGKHFMKNNF